MTPPRWLLLVGVGLVVGPAAVVLTFFSLSLLVLEPRGGSSAQLLGVGAFFVGAVAIWYAAGRLAGSLTMRFGGSPFAALGLVLPALVILGCAALSSAEGLRVLAGIAMFLINALLMVVLGIRAAEQTVMRRVRGSGPDDRRPPGASR